MTSIVQQSSSLSSCPTFPSPKPPLSMTLCQVLFGERQRQIYTFRLRQPVDKEGFLYLLWSKHSDHGLISSSYQRCTAPGLPNSRCCDSRQQMMQGPAADQAQPTKPTTAAFLIQTALLRANLKKSSKTTFSLLTTHSQPQFHPAAFPAPSSYQHLQTSSSFIQQQFLNLPATNSCKLTPA